MKEGNYFERERMKGRVKTKLRERDRGRWQWGLPCPESDDFIHKIQFPDFLILSLCLLFSSYRKLPSQYFQGFNCHLVVLDQGINVVIGFCQLHFFLRQRLFFAI